MAARRKRLRVTTQQIAAALHNHEKRLSSLERKEKERRREREPRIGFRLEQDDLDEDFTPSECKGRR